jgi:hypothetical protein
MHSRTPNTVEALRAWLQTLTGEAVRQVEVMQSVHLPTGKPLRGVEILARRIYLARDRHFYIRVSGDRLITRPLSHDALLHYVSVAFVQLQWRRAGARAAARRVNLGRPARRRVRGATRPHTGA